jgi:hypothetical protein
MMNEFSILLTIAVALGGYLYWGIKTLARERWQIAAAVPLRKRDNGEWSGVNLTWYGVLTANAYVVAVAVLFMLMGAVNLPLAGTAAMAAAMLSLCIPASRLVARLVEKKAHTFTVGGAVFVGIVIAPWIVLFVNRTLGVELDFNISPAAALASFGIAYAFGEGLGRLACISFGCCYGKPLADTPPWLRKVFSGRCVSFYGKTRKIAYAGGLEGEKVLPVQALTAIIYVCCGYLSIFLFLHSLFAAAFIMTMAVTQGWRVISETLRADYRGDGKVSAYQVMGIAGILYGSAAIFLAPAAHLPQPDISAGIVSLWHPGAILLLQALWLGIFFYTGRSTVTGATLSFHIHQERI